MANESYKQVHTFKYIGPKSSYQGQTNYNINGKDYSVAPWNHPATLAKKILKWVFHTYFFGCMIVAPMGHGKTSIAQCIAHFIHTRDPQFDVKWAGSHEFRHQEIFFSNLPKKPHIIIFDDISSALKELTEKQLEANFNSLTRIRWIIDPEMGKIPQIIIVCFHYSKNLEKEFRAQMGMTIFAAFGNEEKTNLDSIAPHGSKAYYTLKQFGEIYDKMFDEDVIELVDANGKIRRLITDQPFRACGCITNTKGNIILYSDKSVCQICVKKKLLKIVPAKVVYDLVLAHGGTQGIQAFRHALFQRGYGLAIHPREASEFDFITQKILPVYSFDPDEMVNLIYAQAHKKVPQRTYRKRKQEDELINKLDKIAVISEMPVESSKLNEKEEMKESEIEETEETLDTQKSENEIIYDKEPIQDER